MENKKKINIQLSALNPYIESNFVENVCKEIQGKDFISWGENNKYPEFLYDLYNSCTTLQSVINGTADYVIGDEVICNVPRFNKTVNKAGDTIKDLLERLAADILIFGGCAIQVLRDFNGNVSELYWVDFSKLRSDKKNEVFFYSEDWNKSYGRVKYLTYPKFSEGDLNPSSIFYYKGNKTRGTYPVPTYNAAIKACMVQAKIDEFHLNELSNNFLSSKIINFNNGQVDDELRNEIEKNLNEKFSGSENAGRILLSFNDNADAATTVTDLGSDDFADRYSNLTKRTQYQIFTAFRAVPALFGLPLENSGFSSQEYEEAFKLYNRCTVRSIQHSLVDMLDKILGMEASITIKPFTLINNIEKEVD